MRSSYATGIILFLISGQAMADTKVETRTSVCQGSGNGSTCTTTTKTNDGEDTRSQSKRNAKQDREDAAAAEARDQKWLEFCKPYPRIDNFNVTRMQYAQPGCDLGRTGENEKVAGR
jgi:hypothetical protein